MFAFQTFFFFFFLNIFKCLSRWGVTLAKEKHEIPLIKPRLCCQAFPRSSITGMWQPQTSDSNPCWCQEDNSAPHSYKDSTFLTPSLTNFSRDSLCFSRRRRYNLTFRIHGGTSFRLTIWRKGIRTAFAPSVTDGEPLTSVLIQGDITSIKRQIY